MLLCVIAGFVHVASTCWRRMSATNWRNSFLTVWNVCVNDTIAHACNEAMDDCWTLTYNSFRIIFTLTRLVYFSLRYKTSLTICYRSYFKLLSMEFRRRLQTPKYSTLTPTEIQKSYLVEYIPPRQNRVNHWVKDFTKYELQLCHRKFCRLHRRFRKLVSLYLVHCLLYLVDRLGFTYCIRIFHVTSAGASASTGNMEDAPFVVEERIR